MAIVGSTDSSRWSSSIRAGSLEDWSAETARPGAGVTSLVDEGYLNLAKQRRPTYSDRAHFFAIAARTMRNILIDDARRRTRQMRGGTQVDVPLRDAEIASSEEAPRLLDLDRALERRERVDPPLVHLVECRFFAALTEKETAQALGVTERTVQREWSRARSWLKEVLGGT